MDVWSLLLTKVHFEPLFAFFLKSEESRPHSLTKKFKIDKSMLVGQPIRKK